MSSDGILEKLNGALRRLDLSGYGHGNRYKGTSVLTRHITEFCIRNHIPFAREVNLRVFDLSFQWTGRLDFVLRSPTDNALIALELDSSEREKSVEKLLQASRLGLRPAWIRWCSPIYRAVPREIKVLDLTPGE